jgi:hypothetical protein
MKVIEATAKDWQPLTKHQAAPLFSEDEAIHEDCILIDKESQQVIAYQVQLSGRFADTATQVRRMLRHDLKWAIEGGRPARLSGIASANKVFGTLEPSRLRQRFGCKSAALDRDHPHLKALLAEMGEHSFTSLKEVEPHRANNHEHLVRSKVHPDWLLGDTPFTSGVINYSAALPYHRDSGNIVGSWSAMVGFRKNMEGGHLHFPEYDVVFAIPHNSLMWFNGQATWHGVTPLLPKKKDSYRFTIVYYSKRKVCDCVSVEEEHLRAAKNAMHAEQPLYEDGK